VLQYVVKYCLLQSQNMKQLLDIERIVDELRVMEDQKVS